MLTKFLLKALTLKDIPWHYTMYHYIKGWTKFSFKKITLEELYQISRLPNCTPHTSLLTPIFPNVFFPTFLTKFGYVNNSMSEDIWQRLTGEFSIRRPLLNCEICLEKISKKKKMLADSKILLVKPSQFKAYFGMTKMQRLCKVFGNSIQERC